MCSLVESNKDQSSLRITTSENLASVLRHLGEGVLVVPEVSEWNR